MEKVGKVIYALFLYNLLQTEMHLFKRLCGVYPETFKDMVTVLAAEKVLPKKTGRPSTLSTEDQILIRLEYWREL